MDAHPVVDPDRRVGVGDADVDVQREGRLAPRELAHRAVDELVALAARDRDLLPDRERVGARDGGAQAERLRASARAVSGGRGSRRPPRRPSAAMPVCTSKADPWVSAETLLWVSARQPRKQLLDAVGERPGPRVEEHRLLLDAERVGAELVAARPDGPGGADLLDDVLHCIVFPTEPALESAAAETNARNSACSAGRAISSSACHWTPSRNLRLGSSTASIVPSPAQAVATRSRAQPVDRLVVERVDVGRLGADRRRQQAAGLDRDRWERLAAGRLLAMRHRLLVARLVVGQVLDQRPAADDVERLRAPADRQHRDPRAVGGARDRQLEAVEVGLGRAEMLVRLLAVGPRMEIGPAGEADPRELVEQRLDQRRSRSGGITTGRPPAASIARR